MKVEWLCLALLLSFTLNSEDCFAEQPNVIVLLADDLGYGELGCQGNSEIPTPHIDSIASTGVRFTQAYVTAPNCSPSRAGFLTGRIPTRFGYEFNPIGARNEDPGTGLPASEVTLAELLHDHGYTTGLIGKWHLGGAADYHPFRHGFDEFFGFSHEGHYFVPPPFQGVTTMLRRKAIPGGGEGRWESENLIYSTHMKHDEPDYDANNPVIRGGQPVVEQSYLTDAFTREAVSFIERHHDKPFFLYLAYNAVHSPLQGKSKDMQRMAHVKDVHRRIFASMLVSLDDSVGQVLGAVEQQQLSKNTLIIFLSDNGGPTRELTSSNLPLRGEKGSMYEGGLRVPFMMKWAGRLPENEVYHQPVSSLDILPSAASIAGITPPQNIDGVDLMPYIEDGKNKGSNNKSPHSELFWRQGHRTALRQGDWKLVKMTREPDQDWELYNIANDLSEEHNLSQQQPDKLQQLKRRWETLNGEMKPALFR